MSNMKRRRFPADRTKLHELLEKREQDLIDLQEEVKELRTAVTDADHTAIHITADAYNVTPEQLRDMLEAIRTGKQVPAELLKTLTVVQLEPKPVKKGGAADDEAD